MSSLIVPEQVHVLSTNGSSRATAYVEGHKILTLDGKLHVIWLEAGRGGREPAHVRTLDLAGGEWTPVFNLGQSSDNHGNPTIMHDSRGFLHALFGGHGAIDYRRSARPNDTTAWTDARRITANGTYPSVVVDGADTLHMVCREKTTEHGLVTTYYRRAAEGEWIRVRPMLKGTLKGPAGYRCYRASLYYEHSANRLHFGFMLFSGEHFKDAVELGLAGYLRSDDLGETWTHFDGTVVADLPTETDFDRVPVTNNCIRVSNLVVGPDGQPCIASVSTGFRGYDERWGEALLWKREAAGWRATSLNPYIEKAYPGHRASWSEPSLSYDAVGNLYIALVAVDASQVDTRAPWLGAPGSIYGNLSSKVVVLVSTDRGQTFQQISMQTFESCPPSWLVSFERFTGHNHVEPPSLIYTRGRAGVGGTPEDVVTEVLLCRFKKWK